MSDDQHHGYPDDRAEPDNFVEMLLLDEAFTELGKRIGVVRDVLELRRYSLVVSAQLFRLKARAANMA